MVKPVETLVDRVVLRPLGEHILHAGVLQAKTFFVLSNGGIVFGDAPPVHPHQDGILVALSDQNRILTGGEDGKVFETRADGRTILLAEGDRRWIEALALGPEGSIAWSVGKTVFYRDGKGAVKSLPLPSTSQGLAFAPKGLRLAIAHVDGATLWYPNLTTSPEKLDWKGPHLDITFSPDSRFVVSSMQENQLHGWRLSDKGHMRMSGYPGKTRSFSWSHDGLWLATSGAEAAIIWPFAKDGPTGKAPRECGTRPARVSKVAFHPSALVLAMGYADGWVLLCRLTDAAELLVRSTGDRSAITALGWSKDGKTLVFGSETGEAGVLSLPV
jgi:Anaphase-promoting complex subunit 4 WD40 domain